MFNGLRSVEDVISAALTQGVEVDAARFHRGGDYIKFGNEGQGWVLYNTFNGKFFGATPFGIEFDSSSTAHEGTPWFDALLNFFYKD